MAAEATVKSAEVYGKRTYKPSLKGQLTDLIYVREEINMKGAESIVEILKIEGVEFISCFSNSDIINPAAERGIRTILARQERVAVDIANGYARVSNGTKIGVCAMKEAVGIQNAYSEIGQAFSDSVPILAIPGQGRRVRAGVLPEYFDCGKAFQPITKWIECINHANRVPELLRRAFTYIKTGRPGPVVLELPRDVSPEDLTDEFRYKKVEGWKTTANAYTFLHVLYCVHSGVSMRPIILRYTRRTCS